MKVLLLLILFINVIFAQNPIEKVFNGKYKKLYKNKALAVAINHETGEWVYGYSTWDGSIIGAKRVAMRNCKFHLRKSKIKATCKLYAINDKKVEE